MGRPFLSLLFCLALLVGPAEAQPVPTLSDLEISLWPEYDQPAVLVIYRGQFAADTPLPVAVEIRIPARAGQPHAVAHVAGEGQLLNQEYTTRPEGEWLVVSFDLPTGGFQLEYYDPLPVDESGRRTYTFTCVADYPVAALHLEFQVPATAEGFALDPAAPPAVQKADGLLYHLVEAGPLDQGETKSWTFTYRKADSVLSVEAAGPLPTAMPGALPAAKETVTPPWLIFLIAFVALIAAGTAAFWLGQRTSPPPAGYRRQAGSHPAPSALFCHQCGTPLRPDSRFCHHCGAGVRRKT